MNKNIFIIGCLALLTAGCSKIETAEEPVQAVPDHLTVEIGVNQGDTRSFKTSFEAGDVVYAFFDHFFVDYLSDPDVATTKFTTDVMYLTLTYNGQYWESVFSNEALENYLLSQTSGSMAVFYNSKAVPTFRAFHGFRGKEQFYVEVSNSFGGLHLIAEDCTYTVSNGVLKASVNMFPPEEDVVIFLPGLTKQDYAAQYRFESSQISENKITAIASDNVNNQGFGAPYFERKASDNALYPIFDKDRAMFFGRVKNRSYLGQEMEYVVKIVDKKREKSTKDDLAYTLTATATITGRNYVNLPELKSGKYVVSHANFVDTRGFLNGHEWVEMADGRKWATANYDAPDETGYGMVLPFSYANNWLERDWGEGWRLPTAREWNELLTQHADITRFDRVFDENGVCIGLDVVRRNDKNTYDVDTMFLPVGGYIPSSSSGMTDTSTGYYWTSSLVVNQDNTAEVLQMQSYGTSTPFTFLRKGTGNFFATRPIVDE